MTREQRKSRLPMETSTPGPKLSGFVSVAAAAASICPVARGAGGGAYDKLGAGTYDVFCDDTKDVFVERPGARKGLTGGGTKETLGMLPRAGGGTQEVLATEMLAASGGAHEPLLTLITEMLAAGRGAHEPLLTLLTLTAADGEGTHDPLLANIGGAREPRGVIPRGVGCLLPNGAGVVCRESVPTVMTRGDWETSVKDLDRGMGGGTPRPTEGSTCAETACGRRGGACDATGIPRRGDKDLCEWCPGW